MGCLDTRRAARAFGGGTFGVGGIPGRSQLLSWPPSLLGGPGRGIVLDLGNCRKKEWQRLWGCEWGCVDTGRAARAFGGGTFGVGGIPGRSQLLSWTPTLLGSPGRGIVLDFGRLQNEGAPVFVGL